MIDITKVQAYNVPPKISDLQNKNIELTNENYSLKRQAYIAVGILAIVIIIKLTGTYQQINKNNEKE